MCIKRKKKIIFVNLVPVNIQTGLYLFYGKNNNSFTRK